MSTSTERSRRRRQRQREGARVVVLELFYDDLDGLAVLGQIVDADEMDQEATLSRGFVGAIACFIESVTTDATTPLPAQVSTRRSLGEPLGVLLDIPGKPADPRKTITLVYGRRDTGSAMGGEALEVYAAAPGAVLQDLADLLCPIGGDAQEQARRALPWSAQLRRPVLLDGGSGGKAVRG